MKFSISKNFEFSASHRLDGLPDDHPCSRMHGHNYTIRIVLESDKLNHVGFVRDYRELDTFKQFLNDNYDHRTIPSHVGNPTAENIARSLYTIAKNFYPEVARIGVSETPKTWAYYSEE